MIVPSRPPAAAAVGAAVNKFQRPSDGLAPAALALGLVALSGLRGIEAQLVMLFAALPTASTAYVLAARMGGRADAVAFIVTLQTLLAVVMLPLWFWLAPRAG